MKRLAAAALFLCSSPALADTLIDNVEGMTLDAQGRLQRFNGLLISNDGRIEQVLQRTDKRPGRVDFRLDGKGQTLMPGIIDAHVDLTTLGMSELLRSLPTGAQPKGALRAEDRDLALAKAQSLLHARGITAVSDMGTTIEAWQSYRRAGDQGTLRLRIMAYAEGVDAMALIGGPGPSPWLYDDRLRLNGVIFRLDGSLAARTAALTTPYTDAPTNSGALTLGDIPLRNLISRAAIDGFQVAIKASGDRAVGAAVGAIAEMGSTYKGDRRWRIEGGDVIAATDLSRLGTLGIVVAGHPARFTSDMAMTESRLGPARIPLAYPWAGATISGGKVAFGSGSGDEPNPFESWAAAITRQDAMSRPFGGWQPQHALTREGAFMALTSTSAWAGFAEGRFGRLEKGQWADFILLDRDPMLASPTDLRAIKVQQTWLGGRLVYQAKN